MQKELFPGSTDFTGAIFKIPQISQHILWSTVSKIKGFFEIYRISSYKRCIRESKSEINAAL